MDRMFIEQIDEAGADMLIVPAEHFLGAQLAYIINWCREHHLKIGLTLGCYTPLCFVEESIYDMTASTSSPTEWTRRTEKTTGASVRACPI